MAKGVSVRILGGRRRPVSLLMLMRWSDLWDQWFVRSEEPFFFKQGVDVPKFLTCIVCISRLQGHNLSSNAPASAPGGQSETSFVVSWSPMHGFIHTYCFASLCVRSTLSRWIPSSASPMQTVQQTLLGDIQPHTQSRFLFYTTLPISPTTAVSWPLLIAFVKRYVMHGKPVNQIMILDGLLKAWCRTI